MNRATPAFPPLGGLLYIECGRERRRDMAQQLEAVQNGVLTAICELHAKGKSTKVVANLLDSVLPKYVELCWPLDEADIEGDALTPPWERSSTLGAYARHSKANARRSTDRRLRQQKFEEALGHWAQQFRLTDDLTGTGHPLPWIVEFGRALCGGKSYHVPVARTHGADRTHFTPPPGGPRVPEPNPKTENFSEYVERVKGALHAQYSAVREQQRSNPRPGKRNPSHYKWFVLHYCDSKRPGEIANLLGAAIQEDTIRKGIARVRADLDLGRK
jgi:hypothetical protein